MKNILIPTDFSAQSLKCVKQLLHTFEEEPLTLRFFHAFVLPSSITDLMMLARKERQFDHVSDEFRYCREQLERTYRGQLHAIWEECFYGSTHAIFKNFLEERAIDLIVYPADYEFRKLSNRSLNPARLIENSGREVLILKEPSKRVEASVADKVRNSQPMKVVSKV